jgi:hypothetical protein
MIMVDREFEFNTIEQADRAMYNLGMLVLDLVKSGTLSEENLLTVEQCISSLDYDGDFVIRP